MTAQSSNLVARAKALIMQPASEWPVIAAEPSTPADLMRGWAVPLAAIGPICAFIHGQVFGFGAFGINYRPGIVAGLSTLVVTYILGLVAVVVVALVAQNVAPRFGGVADRTSAFKLVVYGSTAAWVAGVFQLIPGLGLLGVLGLYSLYLYYVGATSVMRVPQDKAAGFTAVTVLAAALLYFVVFAVSSAFLGMFGGGLGSHVADSSGTVSGKIAIPGGGTVDVGALNAATEQMKANQNRTAVSPDKLQALLPQSIGGYQRTAIESGAAGGIGSNADGTYTGNGNTFHLKVTDMAALGSIAAMGSALGVSASKSDANGYEKTGTVDGHMQTEEWRNDSHSGKFSVMLDNRFSVEAEGNAASIDELKAAVAAIDKGALGKL
ncbi:YIP1 family protein [Novosphingobium sp.]|uniref:YIP1 family protein n=1 Tax=Novosphingobium sp. TaxID=1874826 RepID=UPI0025F7DED8|nr:YIP1 family protein [Novosphingobium sp.]